MKWLITIVKNRYVIFVAFLFEFCVRLKIHSLTILQ